MLKIKRWIGLLAFACGLTGVAQAQVSMRRVLMSIPDTLVPYLNHSMMGELVEFAGRSGKAEVKNKLDGTTSLDTLTEGYAALSLSKVAKMEVLFLPRSVGDTILCVVNTYQGPEPESVVRFYEPSWKALPTNDLLPDIGIESLVYRPDTMAVEDFEALRRFIDPCLISVTLHPQDQSLTFSLSKPLLSETDRKALDAIVLQKYVKWNGEMFK